MPVYALTEARLLTISCVAALDDYLRQRAGHQRDTSGGSYGIESCAPVVFAG